MTKAKCPANCGKMFISAAHAKSHADIAHPDWMFDKTPLGPLKRKGWCTPYGFGDWKEPISYEDACEQMKAMVATIKWPEPTTESDNQNDRPTPE